MQFKLYILISVKTSICLFFKVLSWLNPSVQVNVGQKTFTPAIALNNTIIDQWSDVTGQVSIFSHIISKHTYQLK